MDYIMKVDVALITEGEEERRGRDIRTVRVLINRFIALSCAPFSATAAAARRR